MPVHYPRSPRIVMHHMKLWNCCPCMGKRDVVHIFFYILPVLNIQVKVWCNIKCVSPITEIENKIFLVKSFA